MRTYRIGELKQSLRMDALTERSDVTLLQLLLVGTLYPNPNPCNGHVDREEMQRAVMVIRRSNQYGKRALPVICVL